MEIHEEVETRIRNWDAAWLEKETNLSAKTILLGILFEFIMLSRFGSISYADEKTHYKAKRENFSFAPYLHALMFVMA